MFVALLEGARFLWNPGLVRNPSDLPSHASFPGVRANFPRRTLTSATRACVWREDVYRFDGIVSGQPQKGVRARTGQDNCNHRETLALLMLQPHL